MLTANAAWSQGTGLNACDLNKDNVVNVLDVQAAVNMTLGIGPCTANVIAPATCNIVMIQRVTNAAVGGTCITGAAVHSVALSWTASASANVNGYNVYRSTQAAGPFTKVTPLPVVGIAYVDTAVQAGQVYYYVTTAVDSGNNESSYSNQAQAAIPNP